MLLVQVKEIKMDVKNLLSNIRDTTYFITIYLQTDMVLM